MKRIAALRDLVTNSSGPYINGLRYGLAIMRRNGKNGLFYPNLLLKPRIVVNPRQIRYCTSLPVKPRKGAPYFLAGEWDRSCIKTENKFNIDPKYITAMELILENRPLEKTTEFAHVRETIENTGAFRGRTDALSFMTSVSHLYASLSANGYDFKPSNRLNPWVGGIECAVGRDMTLIKINAGNHRFAGAHTMAIPRIPVHVCVLHDSYLDILDHDGIAGISRLVAEVERKHALP